MPITLESLKRKVGKVTLFGNEGDPDTLTVEYYLVLDETLEEDTKGETEASKPLTPEQQDVRTAQRCIKRIAKWDLTDKDGKPVPLQVDALVKRVPHEVLTLVLQEIAVDMHDPNSRRRASALSSPS